MPNDRKESSDSPKARDESEPRSEQIEGRSFAGASYGATEREQTRDLRLTDPGASGDLADAGVVEEMKNDSSGE